MNRTFLKKVSLVFFVLICLFFVASETVAMGLGAPVINLKVRHSWLGKIGPVIFPHLQHQKVVPCEDCHAPGDLNMEIRKKYGMGNDFHKKFCFPCHERMKVPDGMLCTTCHKSEKKKKIVLHQ